MIIKIAAFMKRRIPALKYMPRKDLLYWLTWHQDHQSLAFHVEQNRVMSAGVARPIDDPLNRFDYYQFEEGAETIYADQAASVSPKAFATLIQTMAKRFPYAKTFMFKNHKRGKERTLDLKRFLEITNMNANKLEKVG